MAERLRQARKAQPGRLRHEDVIDYLNKTLGRSYTRGAYTAWETGRATPPDDVIRALAAAWNVNPNWLLYGAEEPPNAPPMLRERAQEYGDFDRVPFLGMLPCGPWEESATEKKTILIRRGLGGPNRFVFRVAGNSMAPRLNDGDYVLGEWASSAAPGEIVIALSDDGEMTVKRLEIGTGGRLILKPLNPDAKAVEPKTSQIRGRVLMIVPEGAVPDALLP